MSPSTAPAPRRVRHRVAPPAAWAAAALVAALVLGGCGSGSSSATSSSTTERSTTTTTDPDTPPEGAVAKGLNSLQVGQCFLPVTGNDAVEDRAVWVVDCSDPHLYELYARLRYTGPGAASGGFPGSTTVQNWAEQKCFDQFEAFVGVPWTRSDLEIQTWWPSLQSWGKPDRTVLCAVTPADGGLSTGSQAADRTSSDDNTSDDGTSDSEADDGTGSGD
ncbi:MAG: septum formation family protein [Actinomycetes bacterium]